MALSDAVAQKARKGPPCTVCQALTTLEPAESAALLQMLGDTGWRYTQISDELAKVKNPTTGQPYDISHHTLGHHARGHCAARTRLR